MGKELKLSIVIPCWNCSKTIARLLDSVLDNGLDKDDYEVVVCDDKSTDNFLDIVKTYEDKINIVYCTTIREVHCPGNTRQAALPYIHGKWFTFIDNDDMFEPDAFKQVLKYIDDNNEQYVVCTNMREFIYETQEYVREITGETTDTWLHGKYFNKANILDKFQCRFKDDLFSHEDVYFNSGVLSKLIANGLDYTYYPIFTYKWVYTPDSLSRSYYNDKYLYIETYLGDYITGAAYPFFDMFLDKNTTPENRGFAFNQILMTLLHAYFYYEASVWRLGIDNALESAFLAVKNFKRKIIKELGITEVDIINYIYSLPERYNNIKAGCKNGSNEFVERQSFRDFILNL